MQEVDRMQSHSQNEAPEVSVVLPVYQEREAIRTIITRAVQVLRQIGLTFEVIAVDDGSTDGTCEVLQELSGEFPRYLRIIRHPYNKGNGAAIKSGIRAARGEVIACMDADGQHDPHDLLRMLPYMAEYDLVIGARTQSYQGVWYRNLANRLYNALASWLTQFPIEDLTSGYRVFRASIVKQYVHLFPARFSYPTTSTLAFIKGGHNVKYVPITVRPRQGGKSKIKLVSDGWRFIIIIFKIIVIFEPLRVFLPTALILFLLAVASTAYSMWSLGRLHIPNSGVVLFVVSVLVVLLGLIAEQIAALQILTREETRR
jgi:glycosyltransferase involved in cell wall biosynthesis